MAVKMDRVSLDFHPDQHALPATFALLNFDDRSTSLPEKS